MKRLLFLLTLFVVLGMQAQQHVMTVDVSKPTARINPAMYGIFFEDINFGADGGLYAELVKNRSFEFPQPLVGWIPFGEVTVQDERPCFDRNPHYVRITNDGCLLRAGLDNEGYRGIGLKKGEDYRFSAYVRTPDTKPMKLSVELVNSNGENLLKKELEVKGSEWQKLTAVLDAVSHVMGRELAEGRQVHLDGIGYFRVSLTTIEPVVAATKRKLTKVKMAGVKFRADQKLKNEIGTIKAKALKANEHSAKLTDKEIDRRLTNYFATRPFMTRNDFQSVCGMMRTTAMRHIRRLRTEGKLKNEGTMLQPIYVPVSGYYGKNE